ncbi:MAG: phosphosulfolactate synthase [Bacteroidia bacterium]|nr:phosphosulfolactate synthase [Bacteroidia bacterium]MCX7651468.1 phosphosulfolactate synthase [Bacteroidia bacterium]MDW8416777.1 phosphosulfolactate synthase [Bacteroidia bacterium]
MANFPLPDLPHRTQKPRAEGVTMVMDKGLGLHAVQDLIMVAAPYIDFVKLGWTTAFVTGMLEEKLRLYREAAIQPYFGGTLWEAHYVRGAQDNFYRLIERYQLSVVEVSDGSIEVPHEEKLRWIEDFRRRGYMVLSEVGSKDATKVLPPFRWIELIQAELEAGSVWVIAEARESGTVGMYRASGELREGLVEEVVHAIPVERLIFEAPQRNQQAWFIRRFGSNVNLGNVAPEDILSVETMRLGLRGDTFRAFLQKGG